MGYFFSRDSDLMLREHLLPAQSKEPVRKPSVGELAEWLKEPHSKCD